MGEGYLIKIWAKHPVENSRGNMKGDGCKGDQSFLTDPCQYVEKTLGDISPVGKGHPWQSRQDQNGGYEQQVSFGIRHLYHLAIGAKETLFRFFEPLLNHGAKVPFVQFQNIFIPAVKVIDA